MRAVICEQFSGIKDLAVGDLPTPQLPQGGVRIDVCAAGVNFADILMVSGKYQVKPELPFAPGLEVAGYVTEVAPEIEGVAVGDRVMACLDFGGFAEQAIARVRDTVVIPDKMTFIEAAGFPITYGTSHIGLCEKLKLKAGETLLVNGAAGGVGLTAVEIGKAVGARVIATAGGPEKLAIAERYGADDLIDYRTQDIRACVKALTDGQGVDCVFDPVGGSVFDASLRAAAQLGRILIVGFASGDIPQIPANILLVKNLTALGYYWGAHRTLDPGLVTSSFDALFEMFEDGKLKPHVSNVFALEDTAAALEMLRDRKSTGKVVISINDDQNA